MKVNVVVQLDDKEVRDAILAAAREKVGTKDAQGSVEIAVFHDGGSLSDVSADVQFQYRKM